MKRSSRTVEPTADIAREILAYLTAHPKAQDTLEGIMQWWLLEQDIKRSMTRVQAALDELTTRGLVVERKGGDGRVRYRIDRRKTSRIRGPLKNTST